MAIEPGKYPDSCGTRVPPKAAGGDPGSPARYLARWTWALAAPSYFYAVALLWLFLLLVSWGLRTCPRRVSLGCAAVILALVVALIAAFRRSDRAGRRSLAVIGVSWCLVLGPVLYLSGFLAYYFVGPFSLMLGPVALGCAVAALASRGRADRTTLILVLLGCGSVASAWYADSVFRTEYAAPSDPSRAPPPAPGGPIVSSPTPPPIQSQTDPDGAPAEAAEPPPDQPNG